MGGKYEVAPARPDEFQDCYGIDIDSQVNGSFPFIAPLSVKTIGTTVAAPMWQISNPKDTFLYVYDASGSIYTINNASTFSTLGDLTDGGTSTGNGSEYYDNYIYFARDTTVARYGPLDGTPAFTDDYWVTTLGKTALTNTTYPSHSSTGIKLPNHVMHRHSDGRLYFADVVGNQGYIHYISTTKTTVEGDTDNGSTYQKLQLPYGYYPTDIESYGDQLAIAILESPSVNNVIQKPAKIIFWDTISQSYNKIVEFPDPVITALQFDPVSGVLYVFSSLQISSSIRISRFVGGYSFQQIKVDTLNSPPYPGAVDNSLNKMICGLGNSVYSLGSNASTTRKPFYSNFGTVQRSGLTGTYITSVKYFIPASTINYRPFIGWSTLSGNHGIDGTSNSGNNLDNEWSSQYYNIGQPFKIKSIKFNTDLFLSGTTATLRVDIILDDNTTITGPNVNGAIYGPIGRFVYRPSDAAGKSNFYIHIVWSGVDDGAPNVLLPITIDYELIND